MAVLLLLLLVAPNGNTAAQQQRIIMTKKDYSRIHMKRVLLLPETTWSFVRNRLFRTIGSSSWISG
jgi:hypothetical protein